MDSLNSSSKGCLEELLGCSESSFRARAAPAQGELPPGSPRHAEPLGARPPPHPSRVPSLRASQRPLQALASWFPQSIGLVAKGPGKAQEAADCGRRGPCTLSCPGAGLGRVPDVGCFSEGKIVPSRCPLGVGPPARACLFPALKRPFPTALKMLCVCSAGSERPSVCAVDVDFLLFLFFLKSCLLLQVLTQENLATVLTGVMVPAGAVTQPLLIPISIAGQVAGQQGLAVWTIPTATVAALPGLTAASPTGGIFKPPLAGLQGNGNSSPGLHQAPHHPALPSLHVCLPCWTLNPRPCQGDSPGVWIWCPRHPATELLHHLGTLGGDTMLAQQASLPSANCLRRPPPPTPELTP